MDGGAAAAEAFAKEQRIAARRERIAARVALQAGDLEEEGDGPDGTTVTGSATTKSNGPVSVVATQVSATMVKLDMTKARTIEDVTNVRVAADAREHERRATEAARIAERSERLKQEATTSARANAAVAMRWTDLRERQLPADLARDLEEQKLNCATILASKDAIIASLAEELKNKDEEYIKALSTQRADIDALLVRMKSQFEELRDMYGDELDAIETAFLSEREDLFASNKKEVDGLFEQRRNMETKFAEDRVSREESFATELYDMQAADAENYQKLKVKLETDVAILEQQLEHMKYVYLLNTEKLEYNYRVLTERDNESKATLTAQKARLARLRASLTKIQAEYEASDAKFKTRNTALTSEYLRTTRQYRDLQAKFRHFEAADATRFKSVIIVHEEEMAAMAARLITADGVITEQLLGQAWVPPSTIKQQEEEEAQQAAAAAAEEEEERRIREEEAAAALAAAAQEAGSSIMDAALQQAGNAIDMSKLRPLLLLLVSECGSFLIPPATKEMCEELVSSGKGDAAHALCADAVLRGLGAETPAAISALVDSFETAIGEAGAVAVMNGEGGGTTAAAGGTENSLANGAVFSLALTNGSDGLPILPPGFLTLSTLRTYIEAARAGSFGGGNTTNDVVKRLEAAAKGDNSGTTTTTMTVGSDATATQAGTGANTVSSSSSQHHRAGDESSRWTKYTNAVPPAKVRVWKALEAGMNKYETVLRKRATLLKEVDSLTSANAELRTLLATYLAAPKASGLQVPPGSTLRVGPYTHDVLDIAASVHTMNIVAPGVGGAANGGNLRTSGAKTSQIGGTRMGQMGGGGGGGTGTASSGISGVHGTGGAALFRPRN